MSVIQSKAIKHLLNGQDVVCTGAKSGSGKTLAYLVPAIEMLIKAKFTQRSGTGIIVVAPTKEVALEIFGATKDILFFHDKTLGLVRPISNIFYIN